MLRQALFQEISIGAGDRLGERKALDLRADEAGEFLQNSHKAASLLDTRPRMPACISQTARA